MKGHIQKIAGGSSLAFFGVTLWFITARGVLEPARLDADHFDAGAGDDWLLVRAGLALGSAILLGIMAGRPGSRRVRLVAALCALLTVPVFIWSCLGLQRWAPQYSEQSFQELLDRHRGGEALDTRDVVTTLGQPLFTGSHPGGTVVWSYSYMPSAGFGWDKRILWFDNDRVSYLYSLDEP